MNAKGATGSHTDVQQQLLMNRNFIWNLTYAQPTYLNLQQSILPPPSTGMENSMGSRIAF